MDNPNQRPAQPNNQITILDTNKYPIHFDVSLNPNGTYECLVRRPDEAFVDQSNLQKPVIRFARSLTLTSNPPSEVVKSDEYYCTVYTDIDNKYTLYKTDTPLKYGTLDYLQIPLFNPITNCISYSRTLQIQNAPHSDFNPLDMIEKANANQPKTQNNTDNPTDTKQDGSSAEQENPKNTNTEINPSNSIELCFSGTSFKYGSYCISKGQMCIMTFSSEPGSTEPITHCEPFTNFCVIPQSIDCITNRDGTVEKELRLTIFMSQSVFNTITVKPNKTEQLIKEIQKIYPQACLEPFVRGANKHLSAFISKMLVDTPTKYKFKKPGWNSYNFFIDQRKIFYCNDAMAQNAVFSTETGKKLEFSKSIPQYQAFYHAVKMLTLGKLTKTLPLFLFAHIGVMFSIFEEAGYAPNFLLNIVGKTGSLKTSVSKVFFKLLKDNQNDITSNFNDTATAMEIKMGNTFDEVLLIDDFRPSSNKTETARMRNSLEKLVRYFGDGVGKSRGNPMLTLNKEFRPHCVCAITGEYLYGVPSSLLRMLIVHVNANTFNKELLKFYQDNPLIFPTYIRFFIDYLQANYSSLVDHIKIRFPLLRDEYITRGWEARLVDTAAWLDITAEIIFKKYAVDTHLTSPEDAARQYEQCRFAISEAVNQSNELATNTSPEKMFLHAMIKQIHGNKLLIANCKNTYKQNPELYAGFLDQEKKRLFIRPLRAFNSIQQYWEKMDIRFTATEKATRQALLVNGYIQGQSEDDKENTSYVVRLDNNKEVRMLAFYLEKLENEYGKIPCYSDKDDNSGRHSEMRDPIVIKEI